MRSLVLVLGSAVLVLACSSARPPGEASVGTLTSAEVARDDGWSRYQHAVELQRQGRIDVALATYREAEQLFEKSGDRHGHAVAIYGRAHALDEVGRCDEAGEAYRDYAHFVEPNDKRASTLALGYAHECQPIYHGQNDDALDGWADYNRAVALDRDRRYAESVAAYSRAEARFAHDRKLRALAVYGRARAYTALAQCEDAQRAYAEYADLVRSDSPHAAKDAEEVSRHCLNK
jgi:tetratricopeptide (TPR) repeat protein